MQVAVVIPARMESTRLPRKLLLEAGGLSVLGHTIAGAAEAGHPVFVATDSEEIGVHIKRYKLPAGVLWTGDARSGTDRIAQAVRRCNLMDFDLLVNVQADEPTICGDHVNLLVWAAMNKCAIATLSSDLDDQAIDNPSVVKVLTLNANPLSEALEFFRVNPPEGTRMQSFNRVRRHIGVYAYSPAVLLEFWTAPKSPREKAEGLEQLRAMSLGMKILAYHTSYCGPAIDTAKDFELFKKNVGV